MPGIGIFKYFKTLVRLCSWVSVNWLAVQQLVKCSQRPDVGNPMIKKQITERQFPCSEAEWALRVDLAAAFRLAVHFDWHESVGNHFSAVIGDAGTRFLLNPKWRHFSSICASDLLALDASDSDTMKRPDAPDATAWCIHGGIHAQVERAKVLLHCHPTYATTLCCLKNPQLLPIDQNTATFFDRVSIDLNYGGLADDWQEGERLASALGKHDVLMMGNHGVCVIGETVAEAFERLYLLERASRTMVLAYSTGQELNVMSANLAEKTAAGVSEYSDMAFAHFNALKGILDAADTSYRD